ncbi:MAG: NRDE family protein [Planctomycetota bacterium]
MCTVSVITIPGPDGPGVRLVSNRDESRRRPEAGPVERHALAGGGAAHWPIDPVGGGTWIAAAEHGLALTVLNGNLEPAPDLSGVDLISRGTLIPRLIEAATAQAAMARLDGFELGRFAPFRLVATDASGVVIDAFWDRERLVTTAGRAPACFVSSGLGDSVVAPRLPRFDELVRPDPTAESQDAFHALVDEHRPEVGVLMEREDARTVSVSVVEVLPGNGGRLRVSLETALIAERAWARG